MFKNKNKFNPPVAKIIPKKFELNGDTRIDEYYWMRYRDEYPEIIDYIEEENKYTDNIMEETKDLQDELFNEIKNRIKETDISVPVKRGDWYYYSRTEEGKQYAYYCRKRGSMDAPEELLLDENKLAEGSDFFKLGYFSVSPNHNILAYSTDLNGSEEYTVYFKDLNTGELLNDKIRGAYADLCWANDNKTVFYNILNDNQRPYRLYRHEIGQDQSKDALIYEEKDGSFFLGLYKTKNDKYIVMDLSGHSKNEQHIIDADNPKSELKLIEKRSQGREYFVENHGDKFYIRTNANNADNFKVVTAPVDKPSMDNWVDFVPAENDIIIEDISLFKKHFVMLERNKGLHQIKIINLDNNESHYIEFSEAVYTLWNNWNPEFNTNIVRFNYTSFITPITVYDYNMDTRDRTLMKQTEVLGGYNQNDYEQKRAFAKADDDTLIPISLVYKKNIKMDGSNPALLYGYGSYGFIIDAVFSHSTISLLDRGFVYAIAHIRGGMSLGRNWYDTGKMLNKRNTFTDFINSAEYLIKERYTSSDRLAIEGGSAGGLLMGAVTNMRPDLFKCVVAQVPFVDCLNTMLDESLPLTVIEYDEWGNPNEKEYYDYIKSYAPYENVEAKDYPNMLYTSGLNDPRVTFWEPTKMVSKLRKLKTDDNILLLKTNMGAGHQGLSGRYDRLKEVAFDYAFILKALDVE